MNLTPRFFQQNELLLFFGSLSKEMLQQIHLQVNTELDASERVLSWFEQLNSPPLPDIVVWWQCQTLLQEGFTNIVEHGHRNLPPETPIALKAIRSKKSIEIRIWSYGKLFDLEQKLQEPPDLEDNDDERGRGLKIMSTIADGLSYERTPDHRNCLWMKKCY